MRKLIYLSLIFLSFLLFSCKDQGINNINKNPGTTSINSSTISGSTLSQPVGTQLTSNNGTPLINRVMSVSDPMRDPDWDWTEDTIDTLYITSYDEPKPVRRPYYAPSSIKPFFTGIDGSRDIWPEDG